MKRYKTDAWARTRLMFIIEAALEYFFTIMIGGAYLANLTAAIGMSDALTGILSSIVALGSTFQLSALLLANRLPVKRWVTCLHILNQLSFTMLYLVPGIPVSGTVKTIVFVVLLLMGYGISNVLHSPKINWLMSAVEDDHRGRFTATKEIVSLISGMVFSYAMGAVTDYYEAQGNIRGSFVVGAITLLVLTVLHTVTLLLSRERPAPPVKQHTDAWANAKALLGSASVRRVLLLAVLYSVSYYAAVPFYGTWQRGELGFSMTFITLLSVIYAIVRSVVSPFLGRYADKTSFFSMLRICYLVLIVGFAVNVFVLPENGHILYTVYYALSAIALGGINSGALNLVYGVVEPSQRMCAYALQQALAGIAGFLTTAAVSPLVSLIQKNGNSLFGIPLYAQQVVSLIAALLLIPVFLLCKPVRKDKKTDGAPSEMPCEEELKN